MYRVKRYTAATTAEAVLLAKRELGADAFITEVKSVRAPGLLGVLRKPRAEVTAISDLNPTPPPAAAQRPRPEPAPPEADPAWQVLQNQLRLVAAAMDRLEGRLQRVEGGTAHPARTDRAPSRPRRREAVRQLCDRGLPEELATEVAERLLDQGRGQDPLLSGLLRKVPGWLAPTAGLGCTPGRQRVVALVGPTGAGKTTTIAKLAGQLTLQHRLKVGLLAADGYRVGAVAQLRTYGDIMKLPVVAVQAPEEVPGALMQLADRDLILVDTAGCAGSHRERLRAIDGLLRVLQPDEVHLVTALVMAPRDALLAAEAYADLGVSRLLLTKRDEATGPATLLALQSRFDWPLSYITHGQSVPDDLVAAAELDWPRFLEPGLARMGV